MTPYPKIELHVHLEATIQPETLLAIAKRNGEPLPADTVEGLRELFRFRDFDHFIEVWILTTNCLRTEEDFRQVVVDYAAEAKRHGAVYLEAIFSPIERTWRGVSWDEIFTGYCDGAQEARELHGVEVKLTPDITRSAPLEDAHELVRHAARYRDRGIVAVGLGGEEAYYPNAPFGPAFREARAAGLGSVPHAGEVVGPESVRTALDHAGARPASATGSAQSRIRRSSKSWPNADSSSTSRRSRTYGPARSPQPRGAPAPGARRRRRALLRLHRRPGDVRYRPDA